jgi:hypothetical protein
MKGLEMDAGDWMLLVWIVALTGFWVGVRT